MPETRADQPRAPEAAELSLQTEFARGVSLHQQNRLAEAERIFRAIHQQQPNHFDAVHRLGLIALQTRRTNRAVDLLKTAIELNATVAAAHYNLGRALFDLDRAEEALASFDTAIALKPDLTMAHFTRGNALMGLARPEQALKSYDRAIVLRSDVAMAYSNRGMALVDLKRLEEALASFDMAIALRPDFADAHNNQSLCSLLLGRFQQGLLQHEWRRALKKPIGTRSFRQPLWLGQGDIAGKTLFIYWEQGLGDTIQFSRYGKLVEAANAKVVMSVQEPLCGLLKRLSPTIQILGPHEVPAHFDYHCPLLSLPLAFRTTVETIPAEQRYLWVDEDLKATWSARLAPTTRPRIGLVWSGAREHRRDHYRSIDLNTLSPLFGLDAQWICLQKELRESDHSTLNECRQIAFFGGEQKDFADAAALVDLMDLVITVDTSIAHLAGAMGKPVWILLPYSPDWRWLLEREDSPWYPSARLFRQQEIGNWTAVIDRVKNELRFLLVKDQ